MLLAPWVSQAQEQDMVLVSNMAGIHAGGFVISPPDWEVVLGGITVGEGETRVAQQFTTGANTEGYTLRSVVLNLRQERGTGSQAQVAIHRDSSGIPGTRLAVLNTPKAPFGTTSGAAGNRTFSAAGALSLDARAKYWVVLKDTKSTAGPEHYSASSTYSPDEKGEKGFRIQNGNLVWTPSAWSSQIDFAGDKYQKLRMEIRGTAAPPDPTAPPEPASTDATLSGLTVNDGSSNLTLTPAFASDMTAYTASVGNAVEQVTVTPKKGDNNATVEYLDASDLTLPDADTAAGQQAAVAVDDNTIKVKVTAEDGTTTQTYTVTVTRPPAPGICGRTQQVRDEILDRLAGVSDCAAVTAADLATITELDLELAGLTSLQAGDFAGLTAMTVLAMTGNSLSSLPESVFSGLEKLERLELAENNLGSLQPSVFSGLSALMELDLTANQSLGPLPGTVFSGLTKLGELKLSYTGLETLPAELFSGLPELLNLYLNDNRITDLPAGVFAGLSQLEELWLSGNPVDPLQLKVTLEKAGTDMVRAKVLTGAPFTVSIPVTVANGALAGGATALAVEAGSVEGTPVTVIRTSGTTAAVTVDVDLSTQPALPSTHRGYEFVRSRTGLPVVAVPGRQDEPEDETPEPEPEPEPEPRSLSPSRYQRFRFLRNCSLLDWAWPSQAGGWQEDFPGSSRYSTTMDTCQE